MALMNVIEELERFKQEEDTKVLSIYLNTDRSDCQKNSWKIRLKNGLKRLEDYIQLSGSPDEQKSFDTLKKKVEATVNNAVTNLQKSLIIFASPKDTLYSVHFLQVPVDSQFFWEDTPELTQFKTIQEVYPSTGVILANDDEISLINTALGEIEPVDSYIFEAYTDDWRAFEGLAATERTSSSANHRDHYKERYFANQQRWIRSLLSSIEAKASRYNWKQVCIIGQAEYLQMLESELKLPIEKVIRKTIKNKDQRKKIIQEVQVG